MTILNFVWRSRRADEPRCAYFSIDICCVIQEGVITVEKFGSATHCHLDKTNMDKISQHRKDTLHRFKILLLLTIFKIMLKQGFVDARVRSIYIWLQPT